MLLTYLCSQIYLPIQAFTTSQAYSHHHTVHLFKLSNVHILLTYLRFTSSQILTFTCSHMQYTNNNNNNLVWWHCHRVALYKMWYKLKSACSVLSMLNQIDVFLSALQMYLNQKRKTSNQQAKHSNCWGQPPQKISNPSQSDDWVQQCHHEQQISKPIYSICGKTEGISNVFWLCLT